MGKLLTIIGVEDQNNLTDDIFTAEELVVGMQYIYQNAGENPKKDRLAKAISETVRLILQQARGLPLTPPIKEETTTTFKVGDIFTVPEEDIIEFYKIVNIDEGNVIIENLDTKTKDIRVNKEEFDSEVSHGLYSKCNQFSVGDKVKSKFGDTEFTIKDVTLNSPRTYVMYQLDSGEHIYSYDVATNFEQYKPPFKVGDIFNANKDIMHEDWVIKSINDSSITQEVVVEWGKGKGKKETRYVGYEADLLVRSGKWVKKGEKEKGGEKEKENNGEFFTLGGKYSETTLIKGAWYSINNGRYVGRFTEGEQILESDGTYNYSNIKFNEIFINKSAFFEYYKGKTKVLEQGSFSNDQMISRATLLTDVEVLDVFKKYFDEKDIYKIYGVVDNVNILGADGEEDEDIVDQNFKLRFNAKRGKQQILVSGIVVYEEGEGFANYDKPRENKKTKNNSGSRPSPSVSANSVAEGSQMRGNDGKMYIAKKTAKGYNQWKLFK